MGTARRVAGQLGYEVYQGSPGPGLHQRTDSCVRTGAGLHWRCTMPLASASTHAAASTVVLVSAEKVTFPACCLPPTPTAVSTANGALTGRSAQDGVRLASILLPLHSTHCCSSLATAAAGFPYAGGNRKVVAVAGGSGCDPRDTALQQTPLTVLSCSLQHCKSLPAAMVDLACV